MGGAVARGLASRGKYNICVSDPSTEKLDLLKGEFPDVETTTDNIEATRKADILILVVKPWKVKDVIEIEEGDRLMEKLGEYVIADIGSAIDELYLSDFLDDIFTEDSLMAYMVYGISNIQPVAEGQVVPEGVTHTATYHISETETVQVYVVTSSQTAGDVTDYIITRVYYFVEEAETECFTTINGVNDRINGLMNDLTLGEIISITEEDGDILNALSGSTINSLSSDLNALTLQELFTDAVYGEYTGTMTAYALTTQAEGEEETPTGVEVEATVADDTICVNSFPIRDIVLSVVGDSALADQIVEAVGNVDYKLGYKPTLSAEQDSISLALAPQPLKRILSRTNASA